MGLRGLTKIRGADEQWTHEIEHTFGYDFKLGRRTEPCHRDFAARRTAMPRARAHFTHFSPFSSSVPLNRKGVSATPMRYIGEEVELLTDGLHKGSRFVISSLSLALPNLYGAGTRMPKSNTLRVLGQVHKSKKFASESRRTQQDLVQTQQDLVKAQQDFSLAKQALADANLRLADLTKQLAALQKR